jgi:hypothetical protein
MTEEEVNGIIAKAAGLMNVDCVNDGRDYLEAMAWAKKQTWFTNFIGGYIHWKQEVGGYGCDLDELIALLLDPKLGSHALASDIEGRER